MSMVDISKPVKQEVNGTVIHPPLVFPACSLKAHLHVRFFRQGIAFFAFCELEHFGLFCNEVIVLVGPKLYG